MPEPLRPRPWSELPEHDTQIMAFSVDGTKILRRQFALAFYCKSRLYYTDHDEISVLWDEWPAGGDFDCFWLPVAELEAHLFGGEGER
jgi:hypothetical protein